MHYASLAAPQRAAGDLIHIVPVPFHIRDVFAIFIFFLYGFLLSLESRDKASIRFFLIFSFG
jgi:hypothetical protein